MKTNRYLDTCKNVHLNPFQAHLILSAMRTTDTYSVRYMAQISKLVSTYLQVLLESQRAILEKNAFQLYASRFMSTCLNITLIIIEIEMHNYLSGP